MRTLNTWTFIDGKYFRITNIFDGKSTKFYVDGELTKTLTYK